MTDAGEFDSCTRNSAISRVKEVRMGFEPTCAGFANRCLTTWLPHQTLSFRSLTAVAEPSRGWFGIRCIPHASHKPNEYHHLPRLGIRFANRCLTTWLPHQTSWSSYDFAFVTSLIFRPLPSACRAAHPLDVSPYPVEPRFRMPAPKKKPVPVPLPLALREAHDWCESAIFQGVRMTDLLDHQIAFDHSNAMPAEWRALRAANYLPSGARVEVVEGYFFLSAVQHILAWISHLTRHGNKPAKETVRAAKEFVAAFPRVAELRRVLEKDYTIGGWDLPELNVATPGALPSQFGH